MNRNLTKPWLAIAGVFLLSLSCKKSIERVEQNLVLQAMTDGQWAITSFKQNGTNITADFSTYRFKYYSNKTVDAINNGVVEATGNWDGDADAMTTWANFSNASYPLNLINGTWHINNNSWTYVVATQTDGSETLNMRLDKQ